jgi:phosphoadenosine phosphosulfate reductase
MSVSEFSYQALSNEQFAEINKELASKDTLDIIKWAYQKFDGDLVYACSFGAEGIVLIDLIYKVRKNARIVFLDTHKHFKETYELIEKVKARYPSLQIELLESEMSLEQQKEAHGDELWVTNSDLCCNIRKVIPLSKALTGAIAWLSGLRRDQSATRANTQYINQDHKFKSIKVCPLIHWTWDDIWNYIRLNQLDYNALHDQGYPSIGCETCTLPVNEGEDSRAGRWASKNKTECGLHQ